MKAPRYSFLFTFILIGNFLAAAVPTQIHYQGRLTDGSGNPIDGSVSMVVRIYDAPTGGDLLYAETIGTVPVTEGVYEFTFGPDGLLTQSRSETVAVTQYRTAFYSSQLDGNPKVNSVSVTDGVYSWAAKQGSSDPQAFNVRVDYHPPVTVEVTYSKGYEPETGRTITANYSEEDPVSLLDLLGGTSDLYLALVVSGSESSTRTRILAVPYALYAHSAAIKPGSVGAVELASNSVTSSKIASGAVNSAAIADGSITHEDLIDGTGSQMDADLLDGLDSSAFLKTIGGNSIAGTLNVNTTSGTAGYFQTSASGQSAVAGIASMSPTTGFNAGGSFESNGSIGYGVRGLSYGSSGKGVVGRAEGSGTGGHFSSSSGPGLVVSSGRVGIGTESPQYSIHAIGPDGNLVMQMDASSGDSDINLNSNASEARPALNYYNGGTYGGSVGYSVAKDYIFIYQDGNVVVKDGNLGVGTTLPTSRMDIVGDLKVTGAYKGTLGPNNGAPFPRPAWDSGWVPIPMWDRTMTLTHSIGGNVDDYVVDMMSKDLTEGFGINNRFHGFFRMPDTLIEWRGVYYKNLTSTQITVQRGDSDMTNDQVRIRIWVVK